MPTPITRRVFVIVHNPRLPSEGDRPLTAVFGWRSPAELTRRFIEDVAEVSHGLARFEVVAQQEVDAFLVKQDGFQYTPQSYLDAMRRRTAFHQPDAVDYDRFLDEFDLVGRVNRDEIDEVWSIGYPYAGFFESRMVGPGAVFCNAPPLERRDARRRFVVMGFNYERGVGEMLESLGHRAESLLAHAYRRTTGEANLWERFTRYDKTHPGRSECGNVHFAPNSERDYDWGNPRLVVSGCHAWRNFPDLAATRRKVYCNEWGGGDIRQHHRWWFEHFPHVEGSADGVSFNWWEYVMHVDRPAA